jgi:hypothetical protein
MTIQSNFELILPASWLVSIPKIPCGSPGFSCRKDSFFPLILCPDDDLRTLGLLGMRICLCSAGRKVLARDNLIHVRCLAGIKCRRCELLLGITRRLVHCLLD